MGTFPTTLGTVDASERLIVDLYLNLRSIINRWADLTKQTAQARMGYVGQHLVSVVTGFPGGRSGARGFDLNLPDGRHAEIKTCYRVDQLGKCLDCGQVVAPIENACSFCDSPKIKRNDDSKWLISIKHEKDLAAILDPHRYYMVLFEFTDMRTPDTIQASVWEIDPMAPGFALCLIDYWLNIRSKSTSKAPFNLWPYSLKFDVMRPLLIYRSLIHKDRVETLIFPGRDLAQHHPMKPLIEYVRSTNLNKRVISDLVQNLAITFNLEASKRDSLLNELQSHFTSAGTHSDVIADVVALALYGQPVKSSMPVLPQELREKLSTSKVYASLLS